MTGTEKKKILLVDDSAVMRMFLAMNIKRVLPVEITEAENGQDALNKLSTATYDLVLTDVNMPVMTGLEFVRLARTELKSTVPIIMITTMGQTKDRDHGMQLGATGYLTKPVNALLLLRTVSTFLNMAPA